MSRSRRLVLFVALAMTIVASADPMAVAQTPPAPATLLWIEGAPAELTAPLVKTYAAADLVDERAVRRVSKDAAKKKLKGDAALHAKMERIADSPSTRVFYFKSDHGNANLLVVVRDERGFRSKTVKVAHRPNNVWLADVVAFTGPVTAAPGPVPPVAVVPPTAPTPAPPADTAVSAPPPTNEPPVAATTPTPAAPPPEVSQNMQTAPESPVESPILWPTKVIDAAVGVGTISRKLSLQNIATNNMSSYALGAAPDYIGSLSIAPLALTNIAFIRDWQVYLKVGGTASFASTNPTVGNNVTTHFFEWETGLAMRFRTGDQTPILAAVAGAGGESFSFTFAGVPIAEVPSASYDFIRVGGSIEQPIGHWVKLAANGGYRAVTGAGYLASRFSSASVKGFDVGGSVSVVLSHGFFASFVGSYTRFTYTIHSAPTDPYVATGAIDELPTGELKLSYEI